METVTALDEAKILGYFESLRSAFLTKLIVIGAVVSMRDGKLKIDAQRLPSDVVTAVEQEFDDPLFYKALRQGNDEILLNYQDDLVTSLFGSSWIVFEQITKDLVNPDYTTQVGDFSVNYQNNRFQFTTLEKKDIELFYYVRNAIQHHNGAYYALKSIDHRYAGKNFVSTGHLGEKIEIDAKVAWRIAKDLERYTLKAWGNAKNFVPRAP